MQDNIQIVDIRFAQPEDREAIVDLIHDLNNFEADLVYDRRRDRLAAVEYYDDLLEQVARSAGQVVLAVVGDRVIGVMGFAIGQDAAYIVDDLRHHGMVTDLIVHHDWRGRGIGQMLLREAERLTKQAGLRRLMINVLVANTNAAHTYQAFGFNPYMTVLAKDL